MDCSTLGSSVLHCLLEFAQTHVHWVGDAIQPSHPHPFSFQLQSFPASRSFPVSQLFPSGDQSIGASASASVLPMNIQGWFPLGLPGLISCCLQVWKHQFFWCSAFFMVQLSHPYMTTGKTIALTVWSFVSKIMSLLFNTLSSERAMAPHSSTHA